MIDLSDLQDGGPRKDGIPAIRSPHFVQMIHAKGWLGPKEPVQVVISRGEVRVYPLQILIWRELVNDNVAGRPILVSFCPLCNEAVVFDRRVSDRTLEFGVSGMLRNSAMVMFDRETETLWQQLSGEAIVGDYNGHRPAIVSSRVVPFGEVERNYPLAKVLSRETGFRNDYGRNPYAGYEAPGLPRYPVKYKSPNGTRGLDRLLTFSRDGTTFAYNLRKWEGATTQQSSESGQAVFYEPTMVTPLDS